MSFPYGQGWRYPGGFEDPRMPGCRLARDGWVSRGAEPRIPAGLGALERQGMREEKVLDDANNYEVHIRRGPLNQ